MIDTIGLIASIALPVWNIPLMINIVRRKSSADISLWWVMGVWVCILLMAPSGIKSQDVVWRTFNMMNLVLFTMVVVTVLKYRKLR